MWSMCRMCGGHLSLDNPHVCDPEKVRERMEELEHQARIAEHRLSDIQNAVMKVLQPLPNLEGEEVTVKTEWLRKLWDSANCQWHEAKTADSFLVHWMATHRILCEAFDLFRSKKYGKSQTLLEKLRELRDACDKAKDTLGYRDSNLDMTPEELAERNIGSP
jgi:hypothetical protein